MSRLARGLVLLVISATASTIYDSGCLKGYQLMSPNSQICVMITPPGTWLEAFTQCAMSELQSPDPTSWVERNYSGIHSYLLKMGVSEVWLRPSDFKSLNNDVFQSSISWLDKLFYSYHISRWKWSTSSTNECTSFSLRTFNHSKRSCTPEDTQKLPFVCFLSLGEYDTPTVPIKNGCINGTFRGFGDDERDKCYLMDNRVTELLARKDYPSTGLMGRNFSYCAWLRNGINRTELKKRINDMCQSQSQSQKFTDNSFEEYNNSARVKAMWFREQSTTEKTKASAFFEHFVNAVQGVQKIQNKTQHLISITKGRLQRSASSSGFDCLLCAPSSFVEGMMPPELQLDGSGDSLPFDGKKAGVGGLSLTLLNYNPYETEEVTCYTDASLSSFNSPNYKMVKITISPLNKKTHTRELTLHKTAIEDSFFLRLRYNNLKQTPPQNLETAVSLVEFNEGHNHSKTFITIPFDVDGEGNYWCVGRNYITKRPIFTKSVLVEAPLEEKFQRYLVLVETPMEYDPVLYCQKFGTIMARNLNISDANIELKRITSNDQSRILHYHITILQYHAHFLIRAVPKAFSFYFENTSQGSANITSIRIVGSVCPTISMNSSPGFVVNLTSTLKGRRPVVVPVHINGYIVYAVYACVGDAVDGAVWKEITSKDKGWKKEWEPSRQVGSMILLDLHKMSKNPIESDQLPEVTDTIKVLLNQGKGSAAGNGRNLEDLDLILSSLIIDPKGSGVVTDVRHSEVAILVSDLTRKDPVVGISLTTKDGKDTIEGISATQRRFPENSEVMVHLPSTITANYKRIAFAVISNVQSFHSNTSNLRVNSRIVDIVLSNPEKIPDHTKLPDGQMVEIYFKPTSKVLDSERVSCAFWDLQNAVWSTEGCVLERSSNLCRCNHLTHFAQIITGSGARLSEGHQKALEFISIFGCILSLLGLLVIVATGIVFKAWRQEIGNQVLLSLTAALTLNLVTFLLVHSGVGGNKGGGCIFIGIILHYSVLACFCWMLVMSGLQLVRLLTIVGNRNTSKLLLKSSLFAWGSPFIPIAILLIISPSLYASTTDNSIERGFCYPTGTAFYLTVLAPVVCIILVNLVAYIAILCRLFSCCGWGELKTGIQRHGLSDGIIAMRRIRILVFLFFLFGLTWTFAFLAKYIFFAYLFCITATLQGFVIFVFFFVIEQKSRGFWKAEFCQTSGKRNYKSSDTLSSVTYSTATQKTSGSKSSWYVESASLQNKGNESTVHIRSKEGSVVGLSQEEEPLKLRYSQQNMSPPEGFSEDYTDLVPLKRVSFEVDEMLEHKSVIPQIKGLKDTNLLDTKKKYDKSKETENESPNIELPVEIKMPYLSDIKEGTIEEDPIKIARITDSPNGILIEEHGSGRLEEKPIIPQTKAFEGSILPDKYNAEKEILGNKSESPKMSLIAVKISTFPDNNDALFPSTSDKVSGTVPSSLDGSSGKESPDKVSESVPSSLDGSSGKESPDKVSESVPSSLNGSSGKESPDKVSESVPSSLDGSSGKESPRKVSESVPSSLDGSSGKESPDRVSESVPSSLDGLSGKESPDKVSESVPSSLDRSSGKESPGAKVKILQENDGGLPVGNDNVIGVCVEPNQDQGNRAQVVSENQPISLLPPENQEIMNNAQSETIGREETLPSAISIRKETTDLTSKIASSDNKAMGQTNPTKRSQFVITCPITRH